jgi:hypothetical protein
VALAVAAGACSSGGTQATGTTSTTRPTSTTAQAAPTSAAGAGCGPGTTVAGSGAGGKEVNPPGDIPDNQAFVAFSPPSGGYTVKVPEGWARADGPDGVRFTDKFNSVLIRLVPAPAAPTPASAQAGEVPAVAAAARCFELGKVTTVTRRAGPAVLVTYRADSAPDPVTGKVVRDDVERYELWRSGTEAVLTLSGPAGSDNVDPWRMVTDSFAWR